MEKAVRLDILGTNTAAERLYTRCGFRFVQAKHMYYDDTGWTEYKLFEYIKGVTKMLNYREIQAADGKITGGAGAAEFAGIPDCAELQKLYLIDEAKGRGYGRQLVQLVENWAREAGYRKLYLETHTNLSTAMKLYEKLGFHQIEKPAAVVHSTMDHFYIREL